MIRAIKPETNTKIDDVAADAPSTKIARPDRTDVADTTATREVARDAYHRRIESRARAVQAPPMSAVLLTCNAMERIDGCLQSLMNQSLPFDEIVVADNASTDGTPEHIERLFPAVRVERFDTNNGCSGGRNRQLDVAHNEHVFIMDDDVLLDRDCHRALAEAIAEHPDSAVWSPRVVYDQQRDTVQFDGQSLHYLGEAVLVRGDVPLDDTLPSEPFAITVQHGVAFAVDREAAKRVGGFDASFFFGKTDGDFSYRLSLAGYTILSVPRSIIYHRVKKRGIKQTRRQIRNRWVMILKSYRITTLIALAPALALYELLLVGFMTMKGGLPNYLAGCVDVLKDLGTTLKKRKHMQRIRGMSDRELLSGGSMHIRADLIANPIVRAMFNAFDKFTGIYWKMIQPIIR